MGKIRKVKTLPVGIGTKVQMQKDKDFLKRRHPNMKVIVRKAPHSTVKDRYFLSVPRRSYQKIKNKYYP